MRCCHHAFSRHRWVHCRVGQKLRQWSRLTAALRGMDDARASTILMSPVYVCILITEVKPMRVTVHLQDTIAEQLKETARIERQSVSSLVSNAVERDLAERRRRALGLMVLDLAGKVQIAPDALEALDAGRADDRP